MSSFSRRKKILSIYREKGNGFFPRKVSELKTLIQKQMTEDLLAISQTGAGKKVSAESFSLQDNTPEIYLEDLRGRAKKFSESAGGGNGD